MIYAVYNFELRYDKEGKANWVRLVVGIRETGADGTPTGNYLRYCLKTEADAIVQFMELARQEMDKGNARLPFDNVELENSCGYMFKGYRQLT